MLGMTEGGAVKAEVDIEAEKSQVERRGGVQSIDRAVAILRCFDGRRPELGISDLARSTGLSTSTVHRLLNAMQENHLIRQTGTKRYGLGPFLMQLANSGAMSDQSVGPSMVEPWISKTGVRFVPVEVEESSP